MKRRRPQDRTADDITIERTDTSPIFPLDAWKNVFQFLDFKDHCAIRSVCLQWKTLYDTNDFIQKAKKNELACRNKKWTVFYSNECNKLIYRLPASFIEFNVRHELMEWLNDNGISVDNVSHFDAEVMQEDYDFGDDEPSPPDEDDVEARAAYLLPFKQKIWDAFFSRVPQTPGRGIRFDVPQETCTENLDESGIEESSIFYACNHGFSFYIIETAASPLSSVAPMVGDLLDLGWDIDDTVGKDRGVESEPLNILLRLYDYPA